MDLKNPILEQSSVRGRYKKFMNFISDGMSEFRINSNSCALCLYFLDTSDCPLCYVECTGDCIAEYNGWIEEGDPEPMIRKLKKALKSA